MKKNSYGVFPQATIFLVIPQKDCLAECLQRLLDGFS